MARQMKNYVSAGYVRLSRNIRGFCLAPGTGAVQRAKVETALLAAIDTFKEGDRSAELNGKYYSLADLPADVADMVRSRGWGWAIDKPAARFERTPRRVLF